MFTMAKIRDRSTKDGFSNKSNYLDAHLVHNDYYSENNRVVGEWHGKLAEVLGIEGNLIKNDDKTFELLRKNINPKTMEKLTPRSRDGGVRFFDFQCSAQKSVSIMAVTMGDKRLVDSHKHWSLLAMKELEKFAACRDNSTFGKEKSPINTGTLCFAAFNHNASRALDAQLHSHFVVSNSTYDPITKKTFALQSVDMIKAIRYAGKVYQNGMAMDTKKLGYEIIKKVNKKGIIEGFEIDGVSEDVLKLYSKRRSAIENLSEQFKERNGRSPTAAELHVLAKISRDNKLTEITPEEVLKLQREQLSAEQLSKLESLVIKAIDKTQAPGFSIKTADKKKIKEYTDYAIGHIFQRESVVKGNKILAEALNQGLGEIELSEIKKVINKHEELISIRGSKLEFLEDQVTTKTGLRLERWAVDTVNIGKNKYEPINADFLPFNNYQSLKKERENGHDYDDQRKCVREILNSKDKFISFRGVAGSGKTTSLEQLQKGIKGKYSKYNYLSPSHGGKNALIKEGFKAQTVESFKLQHQNRRSSKIENSFLVVDEAGMLSNNDGAELLKIAQTNNMRVLFVGDTKQHKSVNAGDFLRILDTHSNIQQTKLTTIVRQQGDYKDATTEMSRGNVVGGIKMFDKMGWVNEGKGKYIHNSINDYLKFTDNGKNLNDCLFISPTHLEADKIQLELRTKLKKLNIIKSNQGHHKTVFRSQNWNATQKKNTTNYGVGQKILIIKDHNKFKANELVEVKSIIKNKNNVNRVICSDGRTLSVSEYKMFEAGDVSHIEVCPGDRIMSRLTNKDYGITANTVSTVKEIDRKGNIITTNDQQIPSAYKSLQYGYVSTSHSKQGTTTQSIVFCAEKINKDVTYVSATRAKKECRLHVPDKKLLEYQAKILTDRKAALDIKHENSFMQNITPQEKENWKKITESITKEEPNKPDIYEKFKRTNDIANHSRESREIGFSI